MIGDVVELDVGPIAHGGHCVARLEGRVVFVRHTLPGERVRAVITDGTDTSRFLRADAVEVLDAAAGRVDSRCGYAGPGGCGGCDFQHVGLATQHRLLGDVVREQLLRLAGIDREVAVEAPDDGDGLGWRTRVAWAVDGDGRTGLRKHRSHDVVPIEHCPIAHPSLPEVTGERWSAGRVDAVVSSEGDAIVVADEETVRGRRHARESVRGRTFRVTGSGFWQVHPRAAEVLAEAVLAMVVPRTGERIADLYSGVGLFTAFLAEAVGPDGAVVSVESEAGAVRDARRNLHDLPQARIIDDRVERALRTGKVGSCDAVVLDPPRSGAKARVVREIVELGPSRVVYVACDPAALARDVASFGEHGYELADLRAYALFPMTHHVECVALLRRSSDLTR
ncbi:class I SAM-dependent RNA methyltransferase [Solicola gregarius]|uniref:TRAM domain-containing protein n=1 Tax=Solicola gregarius TaxID=2908642 RepID=A0AA46TH66_9ACTN|nr:TRAM domain-containing protein [Solicola gregarius]UYM05251.1 TRAM domain-containing protein [Solicola gregarius]